MRNSRNFHPTKILLLTFCQVGLERLRTKFHADRSHGLEGVRKSRFTINRDFSRIKSRQKWAWPIPRDSAGSSERIDVWFLNIGCSYKAKRVFSAIAPPSGVSG